MRTSNTPRNAAVQLSRCSRSSIAQQHRPITDGSNEDRLAKRYVWPITVD
jgi:hypothetical protein